MALSRRAQRLRPVKSEKHEITWSNLAQNASTTQTVEIVRGVQSPGAPDEEVEIGDTVSSVYFEFNLNGVDNSGVAQVFHWIIMKNPSGEITLTNANPTLYNQKIKRHILKRGMEMLPGIPLGSGGTVQTKRVFVVKIPPRLRRFGQDDKLDLHYRSSSASGINFCGIAIFKSFG